MNDNIEIELKFRLGDKQERVESFLVANGFIKQDKIYELTVMYDNAEEIMQKKDGRLRLRTSGEAIKLSYKKPITREGIKKEIEYELRVSNREQMELILKEMGFAETTSYERYRTTFRNNLVEVTVDEFPFETFMEIEGEEDRIVTLAKRMGFKKEDNLTKSCDTLFTEWRASKGLPMTNHMLFDNYDK